MELLHLRTVAIGLIMLIAFGGYGQHNIKKFVGFDLLVERMGFDLVDSRYNFIVDDKVH